MNGEASAPLFACRDLSLDLGGREILREIGFEIEPGEVLGIIGPNGAGKTSLLEILSGRYTPKTGEVFYNGQDINNLRSVRARQARYRANLSNTGGVRRPDSRGDLQGGPPGIQTLSHPLRRRICGGPRPLRSG